MDLSQFVNLFVSLLVVSNPLSALPAVLKITRNQTAEEKRRTAMTCTIAVAIIYLISVWIGMPLLLVFGIQLHAFQIAGALVLLSLAFSMLSAEESAMKATPDEQKERRTTSGAVVPLAIPIIAGPAAISSIIVSINQFPGLVNQLIISSSSILVALVMGLILVFAGNLEKILGSTGINIINRVGGLILAAIAVQALANGISGIFPALGTPPIPSP